MGDGRSLPMGGKRGSDRVDEPLNMKSPDIYCRRKYWQRQHLSMCLSGCCVVHQSLICVVKKTKNCGGSVDYSHEGITAVGLIGPALKCTISGFHKTAFSNSVVITCQICQAMHICLTYFHMLAM